MARGEQRRGTRRGWVAEWAVFCLRCQWKRRRSLDSSQRKRRGGGGGDSGRERIRTTKVCWRGDLFISSLSVSFLTHFRFRFRRKRLARRTRNRARIFTQTALIDLHDELDLTAHRCKDSHCMAQRAMFIAATFSITNFAFSGQTGTMCPWSGGFIRSNGAFFIG